MQGETVETICTKIRKLDKERHMLMKRLEDLKKNQDSEEGSRLTRSIKDKNSEINTLKTNIEGLEGKAREVASRESALIKYNKYLEYTNEQLEKRLKAKDKFNVQYINRTMATERLLEDCNFGQDFEELVVQMEKETSDSDCPTLHDENVLLRNLYESLKARAMELIEEQTLTSAERHAIPEDPQPNPALAPVTEECPICLADIFAAPAAVLDPCGHFFHATCVAKLNARKTCPTCCLPYTHFNMVE